MHRINVPFGWITSGVLVELEARIKSELRHFDTDEQRQAFLSARLPARKCIESWQYGLEQHECLIVAADGACQIVYCETGFGSAFPWSVQRAGETDLGMDSEWHAYLYESFVCSTMWPADLPSGFMHMAPGEREAAKVFEDLIGRFLKGELDRPAVASFMAREVPFDAVEGDHSDLLPNCECSLRHINEVDYYTTEQELKYLYDCLQGNRQFNEDYRDRSIAQIGEK